MPGTTPVYGFPYPEPTDLVADYPALGQQLAEDIEAVLPDLGGLIGSPPTTIANTGGTATLSGNTVTFTTVNSVSLNGCFTAAYDNYRLVFNLTAASTSASAYLRLRASAADLTSSLYYQMSPGLTSGNATSDNAQSAATAWEWGTIDSNGIGTMSVDVCMPVLAEPTRLAGHYVYYNGTVHVGRAFIASYNATTAVDGVTFYPGSGTWTGYVSVYGYKK